MRKLFKRIDWYIIANLITVFFLLLLPYYLFQGKFYIGGDDTRLFYSFPLDFLKNVTFFSWYNVSTIGINVSNQYLFPFLVLWIGLSFVITNKIILSYFAFSLPLIVGFIFFQKFVREIFEFKEKHGIESFLAALFFILSPILIINQLFIFLTTMWLLALLPVLSYLFVR